MRARRIGAAGNFVLATFDQDLCAATCSCGYGQQRLTAGEAVGSATVLLLAAVRGRDACSESALGRRCGFSKLEGFALFTFSLQGAQWSLRRCSERPHWLQWLKMADGVLGGPCSLVNGLVIVDSRVAA